MAGVALIYWLLGNIVLMDTFECLARMLQFSGIIRLPGRVSPSHAW